MEELIRTYQQPLYRYLCRMLRNSEDAKDVLQNTWLQIYTHPVELREQSSERAYVYRVATNCAYMWLRDEKSYGSLDEVDPAVLQSVTAQPDMAPAHLILAKLEQTVLRLPPQQRAVFNLRYYEELSYDEIAYATQSTVGAVKTNFSLAKQKISRWMTAVAASLLLVLSLGFGWERLNVLGEPQATECVYSSDDWADFAEDDLFLE